MKQSLTKIIGLICLSSCSMPVLKASPNPLAIGYGMKFYDTQLNYYADFSFSPQRKLQNLYVLVQNTPLEFTKSFDWIARTILPMAEQPRLRAEYGSIFGCGDLTQTFYLVPHQASPKFFWGVGPSLVFPTASDRELGFGKWRAGPQIALSTIPGKWSFGLITGNSWSFAGSQQRRAVSIFSFQYFISRDFSQGWFFTSQPNIVADWHAQKNRRWLVPFGGGIGKIFFIHRQLLGFTLSGYYNAVRPQNIGPLWYINAKLELMHPFLHRGESIDPKLLEKASLYFGK